MAGSAEQRRQIVLTVPEDGAGTRLDRFLAEHAGGFSRARVQAFVRDGHAAVNGRNVTDINHRLNAGDEIRLAVPPPAPAGLAAEAMPLDIVHEDAHLIVLCKPAGLAVHPGPGHAAGTLVNALIAHCGASLSGIGGAARPGIVHRLDKDTSGLLVVAKTDAAHQGLASQFAAHGADGRLTRAYLALVWGVPMRPRGTIAVPLGRSSASRRKIAVRREGAGRRAVTRYEVLRTFPDARGRPASALLRLELETGRTHQIRVHMAHTGHPLLGDATYGAGMKTRAATLAPPVREAVLALSRQALHAAELGFEHPVTGKRLRFSSPLPADMAALIALWEQATS